MITKEIEKHFEILSDGFRVYPKKSVDYILDHYNDAKPHLYEFFSKVTDKEDIDYDPLLTYALIIIAYKSDEEARDAILSILNVTEDNLYKYLDDDLYELLPKTIGILHKSKVNDLVKYLYDEKYDPSNIGIIYQALNTLYFNHFIDRDIMIGAYRFGLDKAKALKNQKLSTDIANCIADFYPKEFVDELKDMYKAGDIDRDMIAFSDLERELRHSLDVHIKKMTSFRNELEMDHPKVFLEDSEDEGDAFSEEAFLEMARKRIIQHINDRVALFEQSKRFKKLSDSEQKIAGDLIRNFLLVACKIDSSAMLSLEEELIIEAYDEALENLIDNGFNIMVDHFLHILMQYLRILADEGYDNKGYQFANALAEHEHDISKFEEEQSCPPILENIPIEKISKSKVLDSKKIGRNDPCPCGSGKKYKKCCLS